MKFSKIVPRYTRDKHTLLALSNPPAGGESKGEQENFIC